MDVDSAAMRMPFSLLRQITNSFSEERLIGKGAYGIVYKGVLPGGEEIAVKILHHVGLDGEQFEKEFASLKQSRHQNILQLVGYCCEQEQHLVRYNGRHVFAQKTHRVLCFNYMQNGSLDRHISDIYSGLDWPQRHRIIMGMSEGLLYLHERSKSGVIHGNLKPSNILLDQDMIPKISDFGMSRLIGEGNVERMGTIAYMPPEFIGRHVISHKFDIYSLGVTIIELMTGSRPGSADVYSNKFVEPVLEKWRERLQKTANSTSVERRYQQVSKCLEIALRCVEHDRHERPSIGEIVNRLNEVESLILQEVREIQNPFGSRKYMLLDIDPLEIYFPFMLDISSCSLQLTNRGDDRVAFMLVANIPKRYLTKKSICGVVLPRSANTLALTKLNQTPPTSSDSSDFFTLYSAVVGQYDLLDVDKDYTQYNNFLKKSTEYGDKVQVVKLKVICDRPAVKSTGTSPEDHGRLSTRNCNYENFFALKTRAEEHDRKIL